MERRIAIVTDSTSDLAPEVQMAHGITVIPLNVHVGDQTFRDGVDIHHEEFMELMASEQLPTTSQPSSGAFETTFRHLATTHDAIVCVLISSRLSGTVQSATIAADAVSDLIPVEIVDTQNVSYALGFQSLRAAELADSGLTAQDISATLRSEIDLYHIVFFVETLEHLRRGGRIGKAAQLLGSLLQLRPLLQVEGGQVVPFERTRTRSRAITALADFANDMNTVERLAVLYNTTPDEGAALAERVSNVPIDRDIPLVPFGPVISTHVGPGVLGIALKETKRA